jgi:hypothetical protein
MAGNPLIGSSDHNARRIVAQGLRNPFRMTVRPGTSEVWLGDVGWGTWEEINRITNPTAGVTNFGWPCYEGTGRQGGYDGADLSICENLYAAGAGAVTSPYYTYPTPGWSCPARPAPRAAPRPPGSPSNRAPVARTQPATAGPCSSPTTPATASG